MCRLFHISGFGRSEGLGSWVCHGRRGSRLREASITSWRVGTSGGLCSATMSIGSGSWRFSGWWRIAVRYIVRNPVRAGLVRRVDGWRWTSHAATIGTSRAGVVDVAGVLSLFGASARAARRRYLGFVTRELDAPSDTHPLIEGDDAFIDRHLPVVRPSPEYPRASVRPRCAPLADIVTSRVDGAGIYRAHVEHGYSLRQLATHLGCGVTTVHRRVRDHELRATVSR